MAKPKAKAPATKTGRSATPAKAKISGKQPPAGAQKAAAKASAQKPAAKAANAKSPAKKIAKKAKKAVPKSAPKAKPSAVKSTTSKVITKKVPPATVKTVRKPQPKTLPAKAATKVAAAAPIAAKKSVAKPASAKAPAPPVPAKVAESKKPAAGLAVKPPAETKPKVEPLKKIASKPVPKPASVVRKVLNLDEIKLPNGYRPSPNEDYMCPQHLAYFRQKLQRWRQELILESQETLEHLRTETRDVGDEAERASRESDNILELRTRDRYRKLLNKIDQALKRIEDGAYGFCEETGEDIGLGRLEARPIATLTVDAQERRELFQRQFRDDH